MAWALRRGGRCDRVRGGLGGGRWTRAAGGFRGWHDGYGAPIAPRLIAIRGTKVQLHAPPVPPAVIFSGRAPLRHGRRYVRAARLRGAGSRSGELPSGAGGRLCAPPPPEGGPGAVDPITRPRAGRHDE